MKKIEKFSYPPYPFPRAARLVFLGLLITAFCIISPLVISYTAGYSYNWSEKKIIKTGVLSIDVEPIDASIHVNNEKIIARSPLRLPNLSPNIYLVSFEKEGYHPWQKEVEINSNQTTYIKNIELFRISQPVNVTPSTTAVLENFFPSADGIAGLLSFKNNSFKEIYFYDTDPTQSQLLLRIPYTSPGILEWSPTTRSAVIQTSDGTKQNLVLFSERQNELTKIAETPITTSTSWQWTEDGNSLYLGEKGNVKKLGSDKPILSTSVLNSQYPWFIYNNGVYEYDKKAQVLNWYENGQPLRSYVMPTPLDHFIDINNDRIIASYQSDLIIFRRQENTIREEKRFQNGHIAYNPITRKWIAWSPWEIWQIYDNGEGMLLNRVSEKIHHIVPLDQYGVLLLAGENSLQAFNSGYSVTTELLRQSEITSIASDISRKKIFFTQKVNGKMELFTLLY